ncbi:hypothetical protein [Niallia sp. FSL M8-0099]|uniref:hypothetical protein n=1 Tax=Niallia sp. FSL M8-0099 TaxID=2954519 RepID=UPI0030F824A1
MEQRELFDKILREDIKKLESEREVNQKKVEKLVKVFNASDISKIDKLAQDINGIDHTIRHLYILIGGLGERLK